MDPGETLRSLAGLLATLAEAAVEPLLVSFDAVVDVAGPETRAAAAALLRETAAGCADPARQARLRAAAEALAAGGPCALTAAGQTWRAAAAEAGQVPADEWRARAAADPEFAAPPAAPADAEEEDEPPEMLAEPPPRLPRLKVQHFFPGLVLRLAWPLVDARGQKLPVGRVLRLLRPEVSGPPGALVARLVFLDAALRLEGQPQDDRSIFGNGGNGWFQPVPTRESLGELWLLVDERLQAAEAAYEHAVQYASGEPGDDPDQLDGDMLLAIRTDMEECRGWLFESDLAGSDPGPPPQPACAPVAVECFGKGSEMAVWIGFLFAAIAQCPAE